MWGYTSVAAALSTCSCSPKPRSKAVTAIKLVDALLVKAPTKLVPAAIVAACKPKTAATALKLLREYPSVALDKASVELLLAEDSERLKKLAFDESGAMLIAALCTKSDAIKAALTSPAMLAAFSTPEAATAALKLIETS
jgi:hypothetical protein